MNSKVTFLIFLLSLIGYNCFSQNSKTDKVTLIEKQNGKRLELYAKNTDSLNYVVFLRVTTKDYRRSSNRPVLKPIAPNSETHLLTLIKLAGTDGKYDHQFIVNEVSANLKFRKDYEDIQINLDEALKEKNITIYESDNCEFCEATKTLLEQNKIAFELRSLNKDKATLTKALKAQGKSTDSLHKEIFVIQIKEDIYTGITTKKQLLDVLKNYVK